MVRCNSFVHFLYYCIFYTDSDATNSANSFGEFEEMWLKMGEELEMEGLPKR